MQIASLSRRNRFRGIKDTKIITSFAVYALPHRNSIYSLSLLYELIQVRTSIYIFIHSSRLSFLFLCLSYLYYKFCRLYCAISNGNVKIVGIYKVLAYTMTHPAVNTFYLWIFRSHIAQSGILHKDYEFFNKTVSGT